MKQPGRGQYRRARGLFLAASWIEPPTECLETLGCEPAEVWELAAKAAVSTHQEPLFHRLLGRCPDAPLTECQRRELEGQKTFHAFRWEEIRECLESITVALRGSGIRPVLLKGIAGVGDIYAQGGLRPMRDIDLLVRPTEISAARAALRDKGFRSSRYAPEDLYTAHHHLPPVFHPESGICVELHHYPLSRQADLPGVPVLEDLLRDVVPARALENAQTPSARESAPLTTLAPTWQLLITALHFTHGEHIGGRTAHLFDLARLCERQAEAIEWQRLLALDPEPGLARSLALPLCYLARNGLPSAPQETLSALAKMSRLKGWQWRLLEALLNRYRIGIPPPWNRVSMRLGNIFWEETLRDANLASRCFITARRVLSRGKVTWKDRQTARTRPVPEKV